MDELVKYFEVGESITPLVSVWSIIYGCLLSAVLSIAAGLLYRKIQSEATYSQTLVHTFVLMSMITCLIMLIIGSNIARAFSLVGALSIIRFRTAIKSPFDVGFLFFSMAIGMACGTKFYLLAIVGTVIIGFIMYLLHVLNFSSYPARSEFLLSVNFHLSVNYDAVMKDILNKFFEGYNVAYTETVRQGTLREIVYSVKPKANVSDKDVIDEIVKVNDNLKVSYRSIRHAIEIP